MLKAKNWILVALCAFAFSLQSCEKKEIEPLKSTSEDGTMTIEVTGSKYSPNDPWKVTITATKEGMGEPLVKTYEVFNDEINENSVTFNWQSNNQCNVIMQQNDGIPVIVPVTMGIIDNR